MGSHLTQYFRAIDKTHTTTASTTNTHNIGTVANYSDIAKIDAALTAISGTQFSAARLLGMTLNDKLYALALNADTEFVA